MKLLSVVSVLLVLLASALAQTPSTNLQKGEPFIPADLGGLYSYVDRQTWPSEGFGIIIGFARNRAGTVLYGAMTNAVVRIDLTQPFGLASSRINHVFDVAFASGVVGIQYAEDVNKVYIIASKPTTNIILLDGYSRFLSPPSNPFLYLSSNLLCPSLFSDLAQSCDLFRFDLFFALLTLPQAPR